MKECLEKTEGRCAFRIPSSFIGRKNWTSDLRKSIASLGTTPPNVDVFVDWGYMVNVPSGAVDKFCQLADVGSWNRVVTCGSSAPKFLTGLPPGRSVFQRYEALLHGELTARSDKIGREIDFSDDTTRHPIKDGKKPARKGVPNIRWTTNDKLEIHKADLGKLSMISEEYRKLAGNLSNSHAFEGRDFCAGNRHLCDIADGRRIIRQNGDFVFASINHHLTKLGRRLITP